MGSLILIRGQIPPLTEEQKAELAALDNREIDYSDIPPLRDDERGKYNIEKLLGDCPIYNYDEIMEDQY